MKPTKIGQLLFIAVSAAVLGSTAFAGSVTFSVENNYDAGQDGGLFLLGYRLDSSGLLGIPSTLNDSFNLTSVGFLVGTDTAVSGVADFYVTDALDTSSKTKITVDLGDLSLSDPTHNSIFHDYSFGSLDLGVLTEINSTGVVDYSITASKGGFWVTDADLSVDATYPDDQYQSVPDGGATATLLGMGLLGVSFAARKLRVAR